MRKLIALALVAALMLTAIPMAFAAKGDVKVVENTYRYYADPDDVHPETKTTSGAIAYVSEKFGNFVNWQVPGNALTGNAASWGKWIEVTAIVEVEGYAGKTLSLNGANYYFNDDSRTSVSFYVLPVEGGNQVTRTLQFYDGATRVGSAFTVALIYQDIYNITGSVATVGINQPNTYATIDGGDIVVDVVYKNLIARMKSTNANNANYGVVDYYPVNVQVVLLDKNGEKYPAFTRVDATYTKYSNLKINETEEVPNSTGICYLTEDSKITFSKQFSPAGTTATTLDIYQATARTYGMDATHTYGESFNAKKFMTWTAGDLSATANGINEDAIRRAIDDAIEVYYADKTTNATLYGAYASTNVAALVATVTDLYTSTTKLNQSAWTGSETGLELVAAILNKITTDATLKAAFTALDLGSTYDLEKAWTVYDLLQPTPVYTRVALWASVTAAKAAYRAEVKTKLEGTLQPNASIFGIDLDEITLTLTKPNGEVSRLDFTIRYNSVSRIVAKELTTLDPSQKSVTIVKGESVDVTVKAYQDLVPVTGMPIRFSSYDSNIATATDPKSQSGNAANTNTTTITGVNVGTTQVRAYVQSNSYSSNGVATNVEAETIITVNVVEAAPPVDPTPAAPETTDFVCKVRKLWIRDGAGTSNSKLGYFSRNDIAKVIEVVNGWAKIEFNGGVAYASTGDGKYLSPK